MPVFTADMAPEHCMARMYWQADWRYAQGPAEEDVLPASVEEYPDRSMHSSDMDIDAPCDTAKYGVVCNIPLYTQYIGIQEDVRSLSFSYWHF